MERLSRAMSSDELQLDDREVDEREIQIYPAGLDGAT